MTVSPSSDPPTETTPAASPVPDASPEPAPSETDDGGLWWLLVLLAVGGGLAVAAMMWSRSRAAAKVIDSRFELVRSELTWTDTELLPRVLAAPTAAEAAELWQAGRPRLLVVEEELRQLAVVKASGRRQAAATEWRSALATLVTAVDAETSLPPTAGSDRLRSARARVEEARRGLMTLVADPASTA